MLFPLCRDPHVSLPPITARRPDLDWIRVSVFALLILYHVGMFYVTWDWHVKSPSASHAAEPFMRLTQPWRLSLLFLVSGAATRFMADSRPVSALTGQRVGRLLPPLLLAMFVIVPPQSYYEIVEKIGYAGSYGEFWPAYASGSGGWCRSDECLATPTWNHMWFVAYLLFYTLLLAGLLAQFPRFREGASGLEKALVGPLLLLLPIAYLAVMRVTLLPVFGETHGLFDDWYNHAVYLPLFLFGFLIARSETLADRTARWRWPALSLWAIAFAAYGAYAWTYRAEDATPPAALQMLMRVAVAVQAWCAIVAILGFARRHVTSSGPRLRYLTEAVFPYYIVHQTLIVVLAHHLAPLRLPLWIEAPVLIALTFGGCALTHEVVRRINGLRPWFGLKPLSSQAPATANRPPAVA